MEENKKPKLHEIAVIDGITWTLDPHLGKITGKMKDGSELYEFWVGNPPKYELTMFIAVCDLAVARGLLRRIHTYATFT